MSVESLPSQKLQSPPPLLPTVLDFSRIGSHTKIAKSTTSATTDARFRQNCFHRKNCQVHHPCYRQCSISTELLQSQKPAKSTTPATTGTWFLQNCFHRKNCQVQHPCYHQCPILIELFPSQKLLSPPPMSNFDHHYLGGNNCCYGRPIIEVCAQSSCASRPTREACACTWQPNDLS